MNNAAVRSISFTLDVGTTRACEKHNARKTVAEHVDPSRTHLNRVLVCVNAREGYKELFGDEFEDLASRNNKRGIRDYFDYMSVNGRKPYREAIVQIGNCHDTAADSESGLQAANILTEYLPEFKIRNPHMYVVSAIIHMDEATPHLQIIFIPWADGYTYGLSCRVSMSRAVKQQGFTDGPRGYSAVMQWVEAEKQSLARVMERFGLEWQDLGTHDAHKNIHTYKLEETRKQVENLEKMKDDLKEEIACRLKGAADVNAVVKYRGELIRKLDHDPDYQLAEPSVLMSAKKYMTAVAAPLFERFRVLLKELVERLIRAKALVAKTTGEKTELENEVKYLKRENNILMRQLDEEKQRSKDLSLLKGELGHTYVNNLLDSVKKRKKGTMVKKHDYYEIER